MAHDVAYHAEQTVAEVSGDPRILEALKTRGIDHCCGTHLSLREAAAAAGVPLADLLATLEAAGSAREIRLDVRGLEPPHPMVRVLERVATLAGGETLEVLLDRRPVFLYPQLEAQGLTHETDEPAGGAVRVRIRRGRAA